ncbi:MAG: DUF1461 domain-containing protein [Chloroflexota bacterium]
MNATRIGGIAVGLATALVLVAVAIVPFLSPAWIAFEQDRAQAAAWTGFSTVELRAVTDAILADLVLGPPDFDVDLAGTPVLTPDERSHMRDVRSIFAAFYGASTLAVIAIAAAFALARRGGSGWTRTDAWRGVRRGAIGLGLGVVAVGAVAAVAFDVAFEVFHRVFFPGGNWAFDPRTSRLVQLFPFDFWFETTIAVGVTILVLAGLTAWQCSRRLARLGRHGVAGPTADGNAAGLATAPGAEPVP